MEAEFIARLAELENVIGLKWTSFNEVNYAKVIRLFAHRLNIINNSLNHIWAYVLGAKGITSIIANFCPKLELSLWENLERGEYHKAKDEMLRLHLPLYEFIADLYKEGLNVVGNMWKDAMELCGLPSGGVRPPQDPLTHTQRSRLKEILVKGGVIKI